MIAFSADLDYDGYTPSRTLLLRYRAIQLEAQRLYRVARALWKSDPGHLAAWERYDLAARFAMDLLIVYEQALAHEGVRP